MDYEHQLVPYLESEENKLTYDTFLLMDGIDVDSTHHPLSRDESSRFLVRKKADNPGDPYGNINNVTQQVELLQKGNSKSSCLLQRTASADMINAYESYSNEDVKNNPALAKFQ